MWYLPLPLGDASSKWWPYDGVAGDGQAQHVDSRVYMHMGGLVDPPGVPDIVPVSPPEHRISLWFGHVNTGGIECRTHRGWGTVVDMVLCCV